MLVLYSMCVQVYYYLYSNRKSYSIFGVHYSSEHILSLNRFDCLKFRVFLHLLLNSCQTRLTFALPVRILTYTLPIQMCILPIKNVHINCLY